MIFRCQKNDVATGFLSEVYLESNDIPAFDYLSFIREKYKPGWYKFIGEDNAPFNDYKSLERKAYTQFYNSQTQTAERYYTEEIRKNLPICAKCLEGLHNIAIELKRIYITDHENRKKLKSECKESIYCRWSRDENADNPFSYITKTEMESIIKTQDQPGTNENNSEPSTKSETASAKEYKRKPRHWLLSTSKTLSHFKIKGYCGKEFSYDRRWNKSPTQKSIFRLYTRVFHDIIIPNALIVKSAGKRVEFSDISAAIVFVMKNKKRTEAWKKMIGGTTANDWLVKNAKENFEFYVHDKLRNGDKFLPEKDRWTLEKYLEKTQAGRFTEKNKLLQLTYTPKVKLLIDEFLKKREIGSWSYKQIMDEYHVAKATVAKFFALLKERRKKWSDWDLVTFYIEGECL